jgi:hypothetical protein
MDTVKALILFFLWSFFLPAHANFPAKQVPETWCYTNDTTNYQCRDGKSFATPNDAGMFGCYQVFPADSNYRNHELTFIKTVPYDVPIGIDSYGYLRASFICRAVYTPSGSVDTYNGNLRLAAQVSCVGGTPIKNFSPMTCAGNEAPPPVACSTTRGAIISAFHSLPINSTGCYQSCNYIAQTSVVQNYNGIDFEVGSWLGSGEMCAATDASLLGGVPSNPISVGGGGGLTPADLAPLATEATLKQIRDAIAANVAPSNASTDALLTTGNATSQNIATGVNQTNTKLDGVKSSVDALAAKTGVDQTDPDGLKSVYDTARTQSSDAPGGGLIGLPAESHDVSATFNGQQSFLNGGCMPNPTFAVLGMSMTMDFSLFCQFAQSISFIIVGLAAFIGAKIFTGGGA